MSLIQAFPDGGGGGTNIPNGSTVTPTDDIQIWLKCAELTETYTTLNEVLADDDVMEKLFRSKNASDYLVRSTTWANGITANQTAMILIGANDYCANKLLEDSTWLNAICNSTYFESVLNVKVPVMTGYTTPYGQAFATTENSVKKAWQAFMLRNAEGWASADYQTTNQGIGYKFTQPVNIKYFLLQNPKDTMQASPYTFNLEYSDDGINWTKVGETYTNPKTENADKGYMNYYVSSANNTNHLYWRIYVLTVRNNPTATIIFTGMIQFYGRATKTTIYSAANDIVSFIDDEGAKVVTTDATGKGEVTIVCKPNTDITFTSSIAKDPDNLSENYSKVITVKANGDAVYVMPNKDVLYWYGYESNNLEDCTTANGWSRTGYTFTAPTRNTNYLAISSTNNNYNMVGTKNAISANTIHIIALGLTIGDGSNTYGLICIPSSITSKTFGSPPYATNSGITQNVIAKYDMDTSSYSAFYTAAGSSFLKTSKLYAFWYDDGSDDSNYDKADADLIAPVQETLTAKKDYAVGKQFVYNQTLYKVAQAIAQGAQITIGTNAVLAGSVTEQLGRFPLISEMTAPSISNNDRMANIQGGFKQVGKTVYVDITAEFGIQMAMTDKTFPEPSLWQIGYNFPTPKHDLNLPCIIYKTDKTAKYYAVAWLINTAQSYKGALYVGSNNLTVNNTFSFTVRGTYEAE